MAKSNYVWAIDLGQCALKALKCAPGENGELVAEAFDVVDYPKILSQPEADPDALIREALAQFLERNEIKRDRVAISVSGQQGLARFFKPPPVEAKVLPDIVKYEARQQIPFPLEDVIWDYQRLGGMEVDGFLMEAEIGLFAMKRDQVFRFLKPFLDAEVEVDVVQLTPLCIYNFVCHELLQDAPEPDEIDPENPPDSLVVLAMGTETTDLVITNGNKLWQRSIPLGGNHFTKQLTKELKLTYAKAEQLKRNARQAEDPKRIFQAMRPVFNDLVTEIQRSLTYFQNLDRQAKIGRIVLLGNAAKLPGMRQFLSQKLEHEIIRVEKFERLGGPALASPGFKENMLSFATCYGLCLQGAGEAKLVTNLLPREFVTARMIRDKKPWAVAAVSALLIAFFLNFFFVWTAWSEAHEDQTDSSGKSWKDLEAAVGQVDQVSNAHIQTDDKLKTTKGQFVAVGEEVVGSGDRRVLWLELLTAISATLPQDPRIDPSKAPPNPKDVPFQDRRTLYVDALETEYFADLTKWYSTEIARLDAREAQRLERLKQQKKQEEADGEEEPPPEPADEATDAADGAGADDAADAVDSATDAADEITDAETADAGGTDTFDAADNVPVAPADATATEPAGTDAQPAGPQPPTGGGWVIEITGHHFHNSRSTLRDGSDATYVRNTLIRNLREGSVVLPTEMQMPMPAGGVIKVTLELPVKIEKLGVGHVVMISNNDIIPNFKILNPARAGGGSDGYDSEGPGRFSGTTPPPGVRTAPAGTPSAGNTAGGAAAEPLVPDYWEADRYDFVVQFVWQDRLAKQESAAADTDTAN